LNPYKAYQNRQSAGQTRIDTILSLYEAVIDRLERALGALRQKDQDAVRRQLTAASLGVAALGSAFDVRGGEMAVNFLRLYGFVVRCLEDGNPANLQAALKVLRNLHKGFLAIRPEAVAMERSGEIPPLDHVPSFQARA
jgi:flagellar biosynthetic protein FliS